MKKESMLAAMMFGGQAGGGGGSSSSVLDVVCTVTETGGVASYDYSVSAEDAVAAVNAGKAIRLTVRSQGVDGINQDFPTVNVHNGSNEQYISFLIASGAQRSIPSELTNVYRLYLNTPRWEKVFEDNAVALYVISGDTDNPFEAAQMTTDGSLELSTIQEIVELDGSVAQLVLGAIASAGTAIGTTITDPTTLGFLSNLQEVIVHRIIRGKPCKLLDTISGTNYGFDIISTVYGEGVSYDNRLTAMTATAALIVAGNLCHITLSFTFLYGNVDNNQITQADIAAYCDSHTITFM